MPAPTPASEIHRGRGVAGSARSAKIGAAGAAGAYLSNADAVPSSEGKTAIQSEIDGPAAGTGEPSGKARALSSSARADSRSRTPRAVRHAMTPIAAAADNID